MLLADSWDAYPCGQNKANALYIIDIFISLLPLKCALVCKRIMSIA